MDVGKGTAALLVAALVLNIGWLWAPLGIAALLVASVAAYRAARPRWPPVAILLGLAVLWVPYLYVVAASGLTIGWGDDVLLSVGGDAQMDGLRAATGLVVPLLAIAVVIPARTGWPRRLAIIALAGWLILTPAALWVGAELGPDELTQPDPGEPPPQDEVGPLRELLVILPMVLTYAVTLAAPVVAFWEDHGSAAPSRSGG